MEIATWAELEWVRDMSCEYPQRYQLEERWCARIIGEYDCEGDYIQCKNKSDEESAIAEVKARYLASKKGRRIKWDGKDL